MQMANLNILNPTKKCTVECSDNLRDLLWLSLQANKESKIPIKLLKMSIKFKLNVKDKASKCTFQVSLTYP